MPRKLFILASAILLLHVVEALTLGKSPAGSLLGNSLQTFACLIAVAMCLRASRRGDGFTHSFWVLIAASIGVWAIANIGWTYYEVVLLREPPELSFVRFLFDTQEAFFVIAILLDQDRDSTGVDPGLVLDAVQIALVSLFVYVGWFSAPSRPFVALQVLCHESTF